MIYFKAIRWKNFLSTGNAFTELILDKSANTLVVGDNGAGKSTILDALCYVLYGKPFRKVKKDQLVNSKNGGDCVVEVEFEAYKREYKVVRGMKPAIFEIYIDGVLVNQSAANKDYQEILERSILRMNMKSFTQIVILGSSSFVPFMQLKPDIRSEVIEDLLDIRIFSTMASLLKDRMQRIKEDLLLNAKDIENTNQLIQFQTNHKQKSNDNNQKKIQEYEDAILEKQESIDRYTRYIEDYDAEIINWQKMITDSVTTPQRMRKIESLQHQLRSKQETICKSIKFYEDHNECPTCTQDIDQAIKAMLIDGKQSTSNEITQALKDLESEYLRLSLREKKIEEVGKKITDLMMQKNNALVEITADNRELNILRKNIRELQEEKHVDTTESLQKLDASLKEHHSTREKMFSKQETHTIASAILRDTGIKSKVITQYIPVINTLVNKYLAAMDFYVKFELDEQFNERILSRHRDDFSYNSFSEGEKMRIDLALLFTWRTIARMKNSASTNLLILDEVFDASLDGSGCEEFLKLINGLEDANVFVISHKGDVLQDKFRSSIRFEKHHDFSRIAA